MSRTPFKPALAGMAVALVLAACGGGGSSADDSGNPNGGGGGGGGGGTSAGVSYGTITAFGSVWVNRVEFDTTSATVRFDDDPSAGEDKLRVGMVVRVEGSISGASAATIAVDDALKGRVESVRADGSLVVMGQVVQVDGATQFEDGIRPAAGDLAEVHGLVAGDGVIAAGYIERKTTPATPPFAVKGLVKSHDSGAQTFQVGTLTVTYNGATVSDMPAGSWNGLEIDAKGSTCAGAPVCGTLSASKVEPAGAQVQSASQVEAEGSISDGVLTATKVSIRDGVRIEADVASVDAAAGTFTLAGLPGVKVSVNGATRLKKLGGVSDLSPGNHLRLRGRPGAANGVVATELELRSSGSGSRIELRAAVQSVSGTTSVTLQGVSIDLSGLSDSSFQDTSGSVIGRAAFFSALQTGTLVKVRGDRSGSGVACDEAELESD